MANRGRRKKKGMNRVVKILLITLAFIAALIFLFYLYLFIVAHI